MKICGHKCSKLHGLECLPCRETNIKTSNEMKILKQRNKELFAIGFIILVISDKPMTKRRMQKLAKNNCEFPTMGYYDIENTFSNVNDEKGVAEYIERMRDKHKNEALFIHIKRGSYAELSLSSIICYCETVIEI